MEKEFVPYEQALALKELGFDEKCLLSIVKGTNLYLGGYDCNIKYKFPITKQELFIGYNKGGGKPFKNPLYEFNIPTFSQSFKWFREKYNLNSFIIDSKSYNWYFNINDMIKDDVISEVLYFKTYEEAELECLKKLIEIVKNDRTKI